MEYSCFCLVGTIQIGIPSIFPRLATEWSVFFVFCFFFYFPPVLHTGQFSRRIWILIIRRGILEVSDNLKLSHTQNMLPRLMNFLKKNFPIYIKTYEITKPLLAHCYAWKGLSFCNMFAIQTVCFGMRCGCADVLLKFELRILVH